MWFHCGFFKGRPLPQSVGLNKKTHTQGLKRGSDTTTAQILDLHVELSFEAEAVIECNTAG